MNIKIKSLLVTLLVGSLYYYFYLPPINLTSYSFYVFVAILVITFTIINTTASTVKLVRDRKMPKNFAFEGVSGVAIIAIFIVGITLINIVLSPLFTAKSYSKRIEVSVDNDFITDIARIDSNKLPVIDKDSSIRLGDRVMGRMTDLVSQFSVSNLYTQISYNDKIVRVTPLEYSDIFKVFTNGKNGIEGYITVNSVTGESDLVRLKKGLKYMDSAILNKDINRKLRFIYPTKVFGQKNFELDEEGNPFWIVPTLSYTGINIRTEVEGVVILNPITGTSEYYSVNKVPEWVDHVYPANLIIEQVNNWGTYKGGFLNSLFGQKEVVVTTEGYNYTILDNDVYLYTGVTSVLADESNIGFIMSNLRTKETKFYSVPGAEEFSAMRSAEGQVQQMNYRATFPLLVNLNNKPTYFISLKDNAGLVKMFSFVDVADYQKVVVTDSSKGIDEAIKNYIGSDSVIIDEELEYKDITIRSISMALIDGNSYYYIKDSENLNYKISLKVNESIIPFLKPDDKIKVGFIKISNLTEIIEIK